MNKGWIPTTTPGKNEKAALAASKITQLPNYEITRCLYWSAKNSYLSITAAIPTRPGDCGSTRTTFPVQ